MQKLLLDTHTFLWWVTDDPEISASARKAISHTGHECFLSIVSCWEMAIKSSLGKLRLTKPVERFVNEHISENGFRLLNLDLRHAAKVESLPFHHRDPFDRLLIAQSITEKLTIVSADNMFSRYDAKVLW